MSYMHIPNLYKEQDILLFKECYALEKIDGTSAHVTWKEGRLSFFCGGIKQAAFEGLFDAVKLAEKFVALSLPAITVYGEAYGGKIQGRKDIYGLNIKFVAFEVRVGDSWLVVPQAEDVCKNLGIEFIPYMKISTDLVTIDAVRDCPSEQAQRNGCGEDKMREGIVLRAPIEVRKNNGERIIAKHKRDEFKETTTGRGMAPEALKLLTDAKAIADEWVTEMRLTHVLDLFPNTDITKTGDIIKAMYEDIVREGAGEFVDSKQVHTAIGRATALMFKKRLESVLYEKKDEEAK